MGIGVQEESGSREEVWKGEGGEPATQEHMTRDLAGLVSNGLSADGEESQGSFACFKMFGKTVSVEKWRLGLGLSADRSYSPSTIPLESLGLRTD